MNSSHLKKPLTRHLVYLAVVAAMAVAAYWGFYAKPGGVKWIEAEDFTRNPGEWVALQDVNFSGSRGLMTTTPGVPARSTFTTTGAGDSFLWLRYYGSHAENDLDLWNAAYTNNFGYIDYFGSLEPRAVMVRVDSRPPVRVIEDGSHRYRWASVALTGLEGGEHTVEVYRPAGSVPVHGPRGSVNMDAVLVTGDPSYDPGDAEALPRQISEYLGPLLILLFPLLVWLSPSARKRDDYVPVYLLWSVVLGGVMSVLWIDTDGGFWIWLTQNTDFTLGRIYSEGDALHHRYVYPPPVAAMLIALRPVFTLFGAMDGITPASLILSKLVVIPLAAVTGLVLHRLEGPAAAMLWFLSSVVIFTVAANSMYFGLGLIIAVFLYLLKRENHYAAAFALGCGLAYMSAAMLLVPPFLLMLRGMGWRKAAVMAALVLVPGFLVFLPHTIIDPAGTNSRVMSAGISTWMSMHLGLRLGGVGLTTFLYGALLAGLWVLRPRLDYRNVSLVFALASFIYLHIGAPYFLAWTVAFQPAVIVSAVRLGREVFYSIYVTAMMAWGSFFLNTGGAGDRAGETGFFPYYVFYTWPFDVYRFLGTLYPRVEYFSPVELEALAHSLAAGVSVVLFVLLAADLAGFGRGHGYAPETEVCGE